MVLDVNEKGIVRASSSTDVAPSFPRLTPARCLQMFDAETRRRLHEAGVLPDDALLEKAKDYPTVRSPSTRPTTRIEANHG